MLELVEDLRSEDPETQYAFELEEGKEVDENLNEKSIKGLMIMTGSMKRLYKNYHDVIFMDSTYKTNKHEMPLVVIGGVDHDNKNIVLGFGFLKIEDNASYKWFMQTLLKFTEGIEPGTILTDFDPAMAHGIE